MGLSIPASELERRPKAGDGRDKVTGRALYAGDYSPARLAHAVLVQSKIARGRIAACDTHAARRVPGVLAVLTHENAPRVRPARAVPRAVGAEHWLPLSSADVHFAGQQVALVVGETRAAALEAATRIHMLYEVAGAAGVPDAEWTESLLERPQPLTESVRVEARYSVPAPPGDAMEPWATVAEWEGERLMLHERAASLGTRERVAMVLGLAPEDVRMLASGAPGAHAPDRQHWQHALLSAIAARLLRRPVKLELTRAQTIASVGAHPSVACELVVGAARDGRVTAIRQRPASPALALVADGFALECALDELSHALEVDPVELRRRNLASAGHAPGRTWSSDRLLECLRIGTSRFGWARRSARPGSMRDGQDRIGWGMATIFAVRAAGPAAGHAPLEPDDNGSALGAHFCEVRVDAATGRVRVSRFASVVDVGRVENPRAVRAQVIGGIIGAMGRALMEHPAHAGAAQAGIPLNADVPWIDVALVDEPEPMAAFMGTRAVGAGDVGLACAAAALANAVFHATGVRVRELPITPEKLLT